MNNVKLMNGYGAGELKEQLLLQLGDLLGPDYRLLDEAAPLPGQPILAVAANGAATLIVSDHEDGNRCLVTGLAAFERCHQLLPWLMRLLDRDAVAAGTRLQLVAPSFPEGTRLLLDSIPWLGASHWQRMAGEDPQRLLFSGLDSDRPAAAPRSTPQEPPLPSMSDAESSYFQHL